IRAVDVACGGTETVQDGERIGLLEHLPKSATNYELVGRRISKSNTGLYPPLVRVVGPPRVPIHSQERDAALIYKVLAVCQRVERQHRIDRIHRRCIEGIVSAVMTLHIV